MRSSGLVGWLRESELHVIRDMIKLLDHVQLSGSHLRGVSIHLRPGEWPSGIFSSMDWVSALLSCTTFASVSPLLMYFYMAGCVDRLGPTGVLRTSDNVSCLAPKGPAAMW